MAQNPSKIYIHWNKSALDFLPLQFRKWYLQHRDIIGPRRTSQLINILLFTWFKSINVDILRFLLKISLEIFWWLEEKRYLCTRLTKIKHYNLVTNLSESDIWKVWIRQRNSTGSGGAFMSSVGWKQVIRHSKIQNEFTSWVSGAFRAKTDRSVPRDALRL